MRYGTIEGFSSKLRWVMHKLINSLMLAKSVFSLKRLLYVTTDRSGVIDHFPSYDIPSRFTDQHPVE
jgi:hypothetical protein